MVLLLMACSGPVQPAEYLAVLSLTPSHGAEDVAPGAELLTVFSHALGEVDDASFRLEGPSGEVPHTLSVDTTTLLFSPSAALEPGQHRFVISAGVPALHVEPLASDVHADFQVGTGADADTGDTAAD